MTNKLILEKAIQKAIDGGWKDLNSQVPIQMRNYADQVRIVKMSTNDDGMVGSEPFGLNEIIFNHDFAKALWGSEPMCPDLGETVDEGHYGAIPWFEYHLQQMVISEDPIGYLGDNL